MDSTLTVALASLAGSFLTVLVTSAVGLLNKHIDSQLKINEHKLSIRSIYVGKKIASGEQFVEATNLNIVICNARDDCYRNFKLYKKFDDSFVDRLNKAQEVRDTLAITKGNILDLYFGVDEIKHEAYKATDYVNECIREFDDIYDNNADDYDNLRVKADKVISANTELRSIYLSLISLVRDEVSRYDIL